MSLSEKIKELRKDRNWSQETVANKLNISLNSYGALERGEIDIKLSRIEELARIFDIEMSAFFKKKSENLTRRKEDKRRRVDDITLEDYHLLEFEKYKLELEMQTKKLEEVVARQHAILLEKSRQIEFLETKVLEVICNNRYNPCP
jgi:transcriptional regulator with XRE-family HTH domain